MSKPYWRHTTAEENSTGAEYETLSVGGFIDIDIFHEDGRFYIQVDSDPEIQIGMADDLEEAKQLAEKWAIDQVAEMLKTLGAEGIWLVRGAKAAYLTYFADDNGGKPIEFLPSQPHERILLVRFPAGDGGEAGVEYYG